MGFWTETKTHRCDSMKEVEKLLSPYVPSVVRFSDEDYEFVDLEKNTECNNVTPTQPPKAAVFATRRGRTKRNRRKNRK